MVFSSVVSNVLLMLFYMCLGFLLTRYGKASPDHAKSLSGVLIYICTPAMVLNAFLSMEYSKSILAESFLFMGVSIAVMLLFVALLFLLLHRRYGNPRYRIVTVSAILGNVGYFGLPLVTGLFPDQPVTACFSTVNMMGMNLLVFTLGSFLITADKRFISLKSALLNPVILTGAVAVPLYVLQVQLPDSVRTPISVLAQMSTPLCMMILGMRLASMDLRSIFLEPAAYAAGLLKLIVYPVFVFLCVWFLPGPDETFKITLYVLSAAPSAAVILSLAEQYGCEQKLCANTVLMTTLFSLFTIPLLLLPITLLR